MYMIKLIFIIIIAIIAVIVVYRIESASDKKISSSKKALYCICSGFALSVFCLIVNKPFEIFLTNFLSSNHTLQESNTPESSAYIVESEEPIDTTTTSADSKPQKETIDNETITETNAPKLLPTISETEKHTPPVPEGYAILIDNTWAYSGSYNEYTNPPMFDISVETNIDLSDYYVIFSCPPGAGIGNFPIQNNTIKAKVSEGTYNVELYIPPDNVLYDIQSIYVDSDGVYYVEFYE